MLYREGQEEILKKVIDECNKHKVVFLDAPTGAGKSFMNLMTAKNKGSGFITTPLKLLVDQYDDDLKNNENYKGLGTVIKGKNAYPCLLLQEAGVPEATADGAICENPPKKNWSCSYKTNDECPYYVKRKLAKESNVTVTTLAYLFYGIKTGIYSGSWKQRKVLIIDEAHNIDDQLVDFYSINVGKRSFDKKLSDRIIEFNYNALNREPTLENLQNLLNLELKEVIELIQVIENQQDLAKLSSLKSAIVRTIEKINGNVEFLYTKFEDKHIWKPYEVKEFTKKFFDKFENVILSSATFVSPELLLNSIGLPNDYSVVKVKSTFPAKNSPVKLMPITKINMKNITEALPKILNGLIKIAEANKNTRGFIHCKTYDIRDYIYNNAPQELKIRLWKHEKYNREETLKDWIETGDQQSIFLSVHMGEGVDLKGDLARWQVILKTPYLYMGDKYVKAHYNAINGQKWYNQKTIIELIQMCGRVMRAEKDWGVTYILDSTAVGLLFGNKEMLPSWFKERVNYVRGEIPLEFSR